MEEKPALVYPAEGVVSGVELPRLDADTVGSFLVLVEVLLPQAVGERGLAG